MERPKRHLARTSPSLHLLAILVIFGLAFVGYAAILWSGQLRGFNPSKIVAARDLAFFVPIAGVFFWLTRGQRYRGEMMLLTAAVGALFAAKRAGRDRVIVAPAPDVVAEDEPETTAP